MQENIVNASLCNTSMIYLHLEEGKGGRGVCARGDIYRWEKEILVQNEFGRLH